MPSKDSPARRRIMETASSLFYAEGIHAVGIDRIIADATVAKATFYHHFPSKDELVRAYIEERSRQQRALFASLSEEDPRERLLALFTVIADWCALPGFRGCLFINAAAEYPDSAHPVRQAIVDHRAWFRGALQELVESGGYREADRVASALVVLRDGLAVGAYLDDGDDLREVVREAVLRALGEPSGNGTRSSDGISAGVR